VALVVLLSQIDYDQDLVIGVIQQVKGEAGKYIRRVGHSCIQWLTISGVIKYWISYNKTS
jgi:hypothetical protein